MGHAFSVPFILSCLQYILHLISGWVCQSSPCVYSSNVLPETLGDGGLFIVWYIFNIILNLKIEKVICIFLMIAPSSFPHVLVYRVAWIYSSPAHLCFDELCLTSAFLTNEWLNVTCTVKEGIFPFRRDFRGINWLAAFNSACMARNNSLTFCSRIWLWWNC